ncbi:MAG: hypothetical protein EPN94_05325 [Nitrospirae bacterium]|nr:MAG: hypothetical protein EPN94_05325 [Nitrospirota bacterium]
MTSRYSRIFFAVFLCSFSSLAYEIALTRIFSISLWYHFAFMIISIAMLGLAASGTLMSIFNKLKNPSNIGAYSFLLGLGIPLSYLISNQIPFDPVRLSWEKPQLLYIGLYYIVLSVPFFFTGLIIATAFSSMSERSGLIYGADLLGAGAGSIVILYFMTVTGPGQTVFILSAIVLFAAFIISGKRLKIASLAFILLNLSLFLVKPEFIDMRMSPYKGLEMALRFPGAEHLKTYYSPFSRIDVFKSPAVRFAPGLSVRYLEPLPEQAGIAIDGGEITAVTTSDNRKSLVFLEYLPSALPYEIGKRDDAVIIDSKGGLQALAAAYYKVKNIYKIESNPLLIKVIRNDFDVFSGSIYRENTWQGMGRSWLRLRGGEFDIIDISLMGALPSGIFGISEDYRFTVEAFREYIGHLKPEGILSINLYLFPPPRIELRLLNTIIAALGELHISDAEKHIAAVRSWDSICILVKRTGFTDSEIEAVKKFSSERRFDLVSYPGIREEESNRYIKMPSNEYFTAFRNILDAAERGRFTENYLFDIRPVHDDKPFFHQYLKLKKIKEIYRVMGSKWQYFAEEGYILPAVFAQVFFLSFILIFIPALQRRRETQPAGSGKIFLLYFAFLGVGYMLVETVLIQKMILQLENPSYAVAAVLASMLVSSGIGSIVSYRVSGMRRHFIAGVIAVVIIFYSFALSHIPTAMMSGKIPVRVIAVFFSLMPLGFVMGIPFPTGLKILGERNAVLIPWAWAVNGCFSVLAPVLTIMLATELGFKIMLWFGALAYAMAFVMLKVFSGPRRS